MLLCERMRCRVYFAASTEVFVDQGQYAQINLLHVLTARSPISTGASASATWVHNVFRGTLQILVQYVCVDLYALTKHGPCSNVNTN